MKKNRNINSLNFKIEPSAISKISLIQNGWDTKPHSNYFIPNDWKIVNIISWNNLKNKYNMNFNVLVVDCEVALYYILKEEANFLENFTPLDI